MDYRPFSQSRTTKDEVESRKLFDGDSDGTKRRGRPRKRWNVAVLVDLQIPKGRDWKSLAANRSSWRNLLEGAVFKKEQLTDE